VLLFALIVALANKVSIIRFLLTELARPLLASIAVRAASLLLAPLNALSALLAPKARAFPITNVILKPILAQRAPVVSLVLAPKPATTAQRALTLPLVHLSALRAPLVPKAWTTNLLLHVSIAHLVFPVLKAHGALLVMRIVPPVLLVNRELITCNLSIATLLLMPASLALLALPPLLVRRTAPPVRRDTILLRPRALALSAPLDRRELPLVLVTMRPTPALSAPLEPSVLLALLTAVPALRVLIALLLAPLPATLALLVVRVPQLVLAMLLVLPALPAVRASGALLVLLTAVPVLPVLRVSITLLPLFVSALLLLALLAPEVHTVLLVPLIALVAPLAPRVSPLSPFAILPPILANLVPRAPFLLPVMPFAQLALPALKALMVLSLAIALFLLALIAVRVTGALPVPTAALPALPVRKESTPLLPPTVSLRLLLAPPAQRAHGVLLEASTALLALLARRV